MNALLPGQALLQSAEAWAIRITERYRSSVESIIETGRLINEAKKALPHGEFGHMIANSLPFGERMAQMLMAIANDPRLSNPKFIALLPPSCGTLYDLTRLPDDKFETAVVEQKINPAMIRADVARLRPPNSDGGGEAAATAERPAGTGDRLADALAGRDASDDQERQHLRPSSDTSERKDAGIAPGPSETQMPNGARAIAPSRQEPVDSLDFFPTPPWATRALVEHVFTHLERKGHCQFQTAWEPACGEGHMAEPLREYFRHVVATDIEDYGYGDYVADFTQCELANNADWIITNPPFGLKAEDFVLKALKLAGTGVAMFFRLQWLESVGRYERIFRDHPPTLLSIFAERVPLHKDQWKSDGDTLTAYIWLVWIKGAEPQAPFWIPPGCRERLSKPEDVKRFGKSVVEGEAA